MKINKWIKWVRSFIGVKEGTSPKIFMNVNHRVKEKEADQKGTVKSEKDKPKRR